MPEISLPLSNLAVLSAFLCSSRAKISMQKEGVLSINVDHEKQPCNRSPPTGKVMNKELFLPAKEKAPLLFLYLEMAKRSLSWTPLSSQALAFGPPLLKTRNMAQQLREPYSSNIIAWPFKRPSLPATPLLDISSALALRVLNQLPILSPLSRKQLMLA